MPETNVIGEGNGNPLQYSCMENPMDRGAWKATVHGVAEADTTEQLHFTSLHFCFMDYVKAFDCVDHNKLWKILQEIGIPDHLSSLLRNLYEGQEATVRTGHGTTDWFSSNCCFLYFLRNTGISKGRPGGLVFPSLEEFSTVFYDPFSQRLWHSQQSRSRCFSTTFLLF